jgi:hypothetical protein
MTHFRPHRRSVVDRLRASAATIAEVLEAIEDFDLDHTAPGLHRPAGRLAAAVRELAHELDKQINRGASRLTAPDEQTQQQDGVTE